MVPVRADAVGFRLDLAQGAIRRDERSDALAEELGVDSLAWRHVDESEADLYVNATPVCPGAADPPGLPASALFHRLLVFGCVYRPDGSITPTVAATKAARCPVIDELSQFGARAARQTWLYGVEDPTVEEISGPLTSPRRAA